VLRLVRSGWLILLLCALLAGCRSESEDRTGTEATPDRAAALPGNTSPTNADLVDTDGDGFPERAQLHSFQDRQSFRKWFATIAEMQFYSPSDEWSQDQRDCAGLVRFSVREALRKHDRLWFKRIGAEYEPIAPDVKAFTLDNGPLGERIFRSDFGAFRPDDLAQGKFSEFADARTLKNYNCAFVSRDRRQAQPGDLLFFHEPRNPRYPYHVMIFLGEAHRASEGAADWVVYHTGSSGATEEGTVKKVRLAVLDHHPDARWRPLETNQNFLGFYRLKILG